jgi:hypothetical protein
MYKDIDKLRDIFIAFLIILVAIMSINNSITVARVNIHSKNIEALNKAAIRNLEMHKIS